MGTLRQAQEGHLDDILAVGQVVLEAVTCHRLCGRDIPDRGALRWFRTHPEVVAMVLRS